MSNENKLSDIGNLLEHYSSRAVAHASFFIASIFGIVTFSAIILQLNINEILFWISMSLFLGFSYAGFFTLARFNYYASLADELAERGLRQRKIMNGIRLSLERDNKGTLLDWFDKQSRWQNRVLILKRVRSNWVLFSGYWAGIFLLGSIAYEKFFVDSFAFYFSRFLGLFVASLIVFLPYKVHIKTERPDEKTPLEDYVCCPNQKGEAKKCKEFLKTFSDVVKVWLVAYSWHKRHTDWLVSFKDGKGEPYILSFDIHSNDIKVWFHHPKYLPENIWSRMQSHQTDWRGGKFQQAL